MIHVASVLATREVFWAQVVKGLTAETYAIVAWVVGAMAVIALPERREVGLLYAALSGFLIALLGGLGDIPSLGHSQLATTLPFPLARAEVALSLGIGMGLCAACGLHFLHAPRRPEEPDG